MFRVYVAFILVLAAVLLGVSDIPTTSAVEGGPEMRLVVVDQPGACVDGVCQFDERTKFTLGVEIVTAPEQGYIEAASYIFYGPDLKYDPTAATARDEIVWPDCDPAVLVRGQVDNTLPPPRLTDEAVNHGCLTGLFPPLPVSHYVGMLLEISLTCSAEPTRNEIELLPIAVPEPGEFVPPVTRANTSGAQFKFVDPTDIFSVNVTIIPKLSGLTVLCSSAAPVGGISLDSDLLTLPLEAADPDSSPWRLAVGMAAAAGVVALGGAAWYARKRIAG